MHGPTVHAEGPSVDRPCKSFVSAEQLRSTSYASTAEQLQEIDRSDGKIAGLLHGYNNIPFSLSSRVAHSPFFGVFLFSNAAAVSVSNREKKRLISNGILSSAMF